MGTILMGVCQILLLVLACWVWLALSRVCWGVVGGADSV